MISESALQDSRVSSHELSCGLLGWYAVCTSKNLKNDGIYFFSLFNEPLALYRVNQNRAVCIKDYCPHRGASFRGGEVQNNEIICPYHGARFASDQNCSKLTNVNCQHIVDLKYENYAKNTYLLQYPCEEIEDYIYVYYTGKAEAGIEEFRIMEPLETLLPESHGLRSSDYVYEEAFLDFKCDWDRIVENHLDILHIFWMHGKSLPGNTVGRHSITSFNQRTETKTHSLRTTYFHRNASKDEFISQIFIPPARIIMYKGSLKSARYVQILDHLPMGKNRARVIVRHYRKFFMSSSLSSLVLFKQLQLRTFYKIFQEDYLVLQTQSFSQQMGYMTNKNIRLLGEDKLLKLFWDWHESALRKCNPWDIHPISSNINSIHKDQLMVYPPENQRFVRKNNRTIYLRVILRIGIIFIFSLALYLLLT